MPNDKTAHNDINAEKALIAWMQFTNEFVSIPNGYLYNRDLKSIYDNWKSQYLESGSFQWNLIGEDLEVVLSECMEIATPSKPNPIINSLKIAHMERSAAELTSKIDMGLQKRSDVVKMLNWASGQITDLLTENYNGKEYKHGESLVEFLVDIDNNRKGKNKFKGISSHLPDLDWLLSGWQKGKVYLVSGLEKLGKSRFVRDLFSTWLDKEHGCIMFLLEEDPSAVHECIIGARTKIDTFHFNTTQLTQRDYEKISEETNKYKNQPIYISTESAVTPQYIKSTIQKQRIEFAKIGCDLDFVAIDYIQRMSSEAPSKHEETEKIASLLADIARDENVCLIEVSQLVSSAEKQKNVPLHTQIRFGKVFKEAASTIITLDDPERGVKDSETESQDFRTIKAHIIQRKGKSNITIDLCAELQYSHFTNFAKA